jgi:protein gp37
VVAPAQVRVRVSGMKDTKIRWTDSSWNPMTGCTRVSPGCDHCYAEALVERWGGPDGRSLAFPNAFEPTFKPDKVGVPGSWREPRRIFVNSMSDVFHEAFTGAEVDAVFDLMLAVDRHDYQVLTKRPQRMMRYLVGGTAGTSAPGRSWLDRRGLREVPGHIWIGTSIESDRYAFRAKYLRMVPAATRFLSVEPLLGPVPSLSLDGIHWVIVGGESGPGWRPMDPQWARDVRDRCLAAGKPFFYKQGAAFRTEHDVELDGQRWEQFPRPHPSERAAGAGRLELRVER